MAPVILSPYDWLLVISKFLIGQAGGTPMTHIARAQKRVGATFSESFTRLLRIASFITARDKQARNERGNVFEEAIAV